MILKGLDVAPKYCDLCGTGLISNWALLREYAFCSGCFRHLLSLGRSIQQESIGGVNRNIGRIFCIKPSGRVIQTLHHIFTQCRLTNHTAYAPLFVEGFGPVIRYNLADIHSGLISYYAAELLRESIALWQVLGKQVRL